MRALLTVGGYGRFSKLRHLARLPAPIPTSQPNDVLWFRLLAVGVTLFIRRAEPGLADQRAPGLAAAAKP